MMWLLGWFCLICGGGVNVDKYMFWVAKTARKEGHSSLVLHQMGVPETPEES